MNMDEKVGNKRFTVYDSEADTVLELLNELGSLTNNVCDSLDNKTDLFGDHKGSWQGLNRPTMSDEGMRATVEDIIDNKIPSIQSSLDNMELETNEKIETIYNNNLRIFKPKFGFNCLGSPASDCKTLEEQITMFNKMIDIGVEEISLCLNIIENSDGTMYNKDDNNMIDESIRYCIDNNIKISTIHLYVNQEFNTIEDNFNKNYKEIVKEVLEKYDYIDYEYLIVWNEATVRIRNSVVCNTILECMEIVKEYNKKVGIALMGVSPINYIDKSIFENSDFICFNYYQSIGDKYDKTSVQDGINAWCNGEINDLINFANNTYPDKEVIIGESGIIGSYECLLGPAGIPRNWATYDFNGRVCEIYYTGLFEALKNSNIKKAYGWFPHDFVKYPEPVKKILSKYLKGGK